MKRKAMFFVKKKCKKEEIEIKHVKDCHNLRAFIWEGLRLSSVVKAGVPRATTGAIQVENYKKLRSWWFKFGSNIIFDTFVSYIF